MHRRTATIQEDESESFLGEKIQMVDQWDDIFEATQQDAWWMPSSVVKVDTSDVRYTYDSDGRHRYSLVTRVSPVLDEYSVLVDEIMERQRPTGRSNFMIASPSYSQGLEMALLDKGYSCRGVADCWSIQVEAPRPSIPDHIHVKRVETEEDLRHMDAVLVSCFEHSEPDDDETIRRNLEGCTGPDARCRRYVAYDKASGQPLSVGSFNVFSDLGVGFMWGGSTVADARGQGVYSAIVTARMRDAQAMGLRRIGLYALRTTSGPIIERQGFDKHGRVNFWYQAFESTAQLTG